MTTALYRGRLIVDPTAEEEALATTAVTVCLDGDGAVVAVLKPGGDAEATESPSRTLRRGGEGEVRDARRRCATRSGKIFDLKPAVCSDTVWVVCSIHSLRTFVSTRTT